MNEAVSLQKSLVHARIIENAGNGVVKGKYDAVDSLPGV
jgi:hypothetical protein